MGPLLKGDGNLRFRLVLLESDLPSNITCFDKNASVADSSNRIGRISKPWDFTEKPNLLMEVTDSLGLAGHKITPDFRSILMAE